MKFLFILTVSVIMSISMIPVSDARLGSAADWNIGGIGQSDGGDPLLFSLGDISVSTTRNWSEQHESFLTEFDLYDVGYDVTLSRTINEGTMSFFLDIDEDGKLSNGTEWLFDQKENTYQILQRPLIDSNQNGWFDYGDEHWNLAMVKDGNTIYHASELGIIGFNWSDAVFVEDDDYGKGTYCDWIRDTCEHFRIVAYNDNGILLQGGETIVTFGGLMGHLEIP